MIDLRSDTVTTPCPQMRDAMMNAEVGDDVYGEDPTVNRLEAMAAEVTGKEAALFVTSGTQGNLVSLLSHCQRGDEYIAGQDAHAYRYEAGGAAVLGGIQPQPIPFNIKGELDLDDIAAVIKPNDSHFAKSRLLCLENTQGGKVLAMDYLVAATDVARERSLRTHLDGARLYNAAVKLSLDIKEITKLFDSVSICLSKGLGAPAGSVVVGNQALIDDARRWRKMLGGGLRQAGYIAAAGIYALQNNVERLAEDHDNAAYLAFELDQMPRFKLKEPPQTNMVMLGNQPGWIAGLRRWLAEHDVTISGSRWVCHKDVSRADIDRVLSLCREYVS